MFLSVETAVSADAFVDSIGVNSHFGWTNIYANANTQTLLGQLGVRHVRDNAKSTAYSRLASLYSIYGINTAIVVDDLALTPASQVSALSNNWAEAIEGANEPDLNGRTYKGFTDNATTNDFAATRRYQEELFQAVQANGSTVNKPVLSPAMGNTVRAGALAGTSYDIEAMHAYAGNDTPTVWRLDSQYIPQTHLMAGGGGATAPTWATETGYYTGTAPGRISEVANAKYLPRTLVDYFNRGIARTYLYEFANQGTDLTNPQYNFGLIRNDFSLTPAYTDIKNMISLLKEATWNSGTQTWSKPSFTPGSLDYTMSTSTPTINKLLLQKSNGEFDLLLWNEVASWDRTNNVDVNNAAQNVTLTFNTPLAGASLYSLDSTTAAQSWTNPTQITLSVPDEVVVLKLTPRASTAPSAIGYSANFESDTLNAVPSGWTQNAGDDWEVKNLASPANKWLENRNVSGSRSITHNLGTSVTGSWTIDFDHTWRWGGWAASPSNGFHSLSVAFDMLDTSGSGYRVKIYQGNSNNTSYDNDLTEIYKVTAGVQGASPLTTGGGYNRAGWQSVVSSTPDWRHVRVSFDAGSHTLFVYEDPDANGVYDVVVQATDNSYSSFSKMVLSAPDLSATCAPMFDNINTSTPTVTIAATDAGVGENPVNPGTFTVTRTGSTASPLVVKYTVGGSATNGTDYSSLSGAVTIAAGAASALITITPTSDTALEGDENVVLTLSEAAGYHAGNQRSADVKIVDYAADLIVTGIAFSNPGPTAGNLVRFTATVKNIGTAPTPAGTVVKVNFFIDDNPGTTPYTSNTYNSSIAPGQSVNLTTNAGGTSGQWTAALGIHNVTAWVDPNPAFWYLVPGDILEKSDVNNENYAILNVAQAQTVDDFSTGTVGSPPAGWTTSGSGWAVKNDGGQNFLEFTGNGTQSITKTLASAATGSWELDVKTSWRWGGFLSPVAGQHSQSTAYDLLDAAGNGYRIKLYQGNSNNTAYDNDLIQIYRVTANVVAATPLTTGGGFNVPGWKSRSLSAPDWRNLRITFDKGTQRLSVSGDSTGTGVYTPFVSYVDTFASTSISKVSLVAVGVTANCAPEFDNFRFKTLI